MVRRTVPLFKTDNEPKPSTRYPSCSRVDFVLVWVSAFWLFWVFFLLSKKVTPQSLFSVLSDCVAPGSKRIVGPSFQRWNTPLTTLSKDKEHSVVARGFTKEHTSLPQVLFYFPPSPRTQSMALESAQLDKWSMANCQVEEWKAHHHPTPHPALGKWMKHQL